MTRAELLAALTSERYTNTWWTTPATEPQADDEVTCARRRRDMARDFVAPCSRVRAARVREEADR